MGDAGAGGTLVSSSSVAVSTVFTAQFTAKLMALVFAYRRHWALRHRRGRSCASITRSLSLKTTLYDDYLSEAKCEAWLPVMIVKRRQVCSRGGLEASLIVAVR